MLELNFDKVFHLGDALKKSWEFITKYPKETLFPLVIYAITGLFLAIINLVIKISSVVELFTVNSDKIKQGIQPQVIIIIVIAALFILFLTILIYGYIEYYCIRIGIKWFLNQEEPQIPRDLKFDYRIFGRYLLLGLVVALIVIGGVILIIIPGIIWSLMYFFATHYFVLHHSSIKESLNMSSKITYGIKWQLFGTTLLVGIIRGLFQDADNVTTNYILVLLASFIGIFMSYAYTYLFIDLYQQTFQDTGDELIVQQASNPDEIQDSQQQSVRES